MNTFTASIIIFILVCMILGYRRGLVRSMLKIAFTGLSLLLAYFLAPLAGGILMEKTQIDDVIEEKIYAFIEEEAEKRVKEEMQDLLGNYVQDGFTEDIPDEIMDPLVEAVLSKEPDLEEQTNLINSLEYPQFIKDMLIANNNQDTKTELGATNFYTYISCYVAYMVTNAIAFIMTFAIMILLFDIIMLIANIATSLPVINTLNRIGGMLLAGGEAIIIVWIVFAVIIVAADTSIGAQLAEQITESKILSIINEHNIFNSLIKNIAKI